MALRWCRHWELSRRCGHAREGDSYVGPPEEEAEDGPVGVLCPAQDAGQHPEEEVEGMGEEVEDDGEVVQVGVVPRDSHPVLDRPHQALRGAVGAPHKGIAQGQHHHPGCVVGHPQDQAQACGPVARPEQAHAQDEVHHRCSLSTEREQRKLTE